MAEGPGSHRARHLGRHDSGARCSSSPPVSGDARLRAGVSRVGDGPPGHTGVDGAGRKLHRKSAGEGINWRVHCFYPRRMTPNNRLTLAAGILGASLLWAPFRAGATLVQTVPFDDKVSNAESIVLGRCTET